ncbi:hypothetical protein ASPCAL13553 [Aspergillus calidoustus]|uniref:BZIP domain-containing protein n=1 Tax=Aspergillus calidoustus TaxID=454130 RepID=A0A0U5GDP1_ASPCI|nr:hypothetical protein ASPCAL13553 [Aspergillus calidoustus]
MKDEQQDSEERRRKQIRLAQQTYRRRKEIMITNLQTRVQELESGIEELSESFLSFSDILLENDILEKHPRVTSALHKIGHQFVSLAKSGCDDDHDQSSAGNNATNTPLPKKLSVARNTNLDSHPDLAQHGTLPVIENKTQSSLATRAQSQLPLTPPYQEQPILPFEIDLPSPTVPTSTSSPPLYNALPIPPLGNLTKQGWTFSHSLARECYENGYRLLVDSPDNYTTIQEIFGRQLTTFERNHMISAFYAAMHDEVGDIIKLHATFLSSLRSKNNSYSTEQRMISSKTRQNEIQSTLDEWLDASGVQGFLHRKGINIQNTGSVCSSPPSDSQAKFNVLGFIRLLSLGPLCFGRGPAFRMRDVEDALHLTTSENPLPFDSFYMNSPTL